MLWVEVYSFKIHAEHQWDGSEAGATGIKSDDLRSVPRYYTEEGEMTSSTLSSDLHIHVKQIKNACGIHVILKLNQVKLFLICHDFEFLRKEKSGDRYTGDKLRAAH